MEKVEELTGLSRVIEYFKEKGEVVEIEKEVDLECELTGVVSALNSLPRTPGVLFKNLKGYDFPGAACILSERDRTCQILGLPTSPVKFKEAFMKATENLIPSVEVNEAPCKELVHTSNFDALKIVPSVKVTPDDGGRYFQPLVISKDPETGVQNVAMNRAMLLQDNTLVLNVRNETGVGNHFVKCKKEGKPFEVALVMGVPFEMYISAATKLPLGQDELSLAGSLQGKAVEMVRCETIDVQVPAEAGFVIEGVIEPPYDLASEGPWPEFLKYLSIPQRKPVMKIQALTLRESAIAYLIVAGTKENFNLRISNDVAFYKYVKALEPNFVMDATLTPGSAHWHHGIIQVKKDEYDLEGLQTHLAMAAFGFSVYLETITLVDEDVNILDMNEVEWAVTTRCNPSEQIHIIPEVKAHRNNPIAGVRELLDGSFVGKAKMIVDATVPWKYKSLKRGEGKLALFERAKFQEVDLEDYLHPDDHNRWVK
ncbi:UbiD family decarboxylase [Acidobacteria bacterium AH-259-D05]|nr:UbiD family decarboxylase [Acidobacteria bacterium AH-259-D05]